jgi:VanZ family protein
VSDPQPWPTCTPAAILPEAPPRLPAWLRAWWPAFLWAAVIFALSTDPFSSSHTAGILEPVIHWFVPSFSPGQVEFIHYVIRKTAHFTEYFIFGLFLYRAVRGSQKGWHWTWGLTAWFIAACYSALDEIHQAFVASRTASAYDSLLDSAGAFVAILILFVIFRLRQARPPAARPIPEAS